MSAVDKNPSTPNPLSRVNWRMFLRRAPNVNFTIQTVNIPGLRLPSTYMPNPFVQIPEPGDHLLYNELDVEFLVDENFDNYMEIHAWIKGLGFPNDYEEYKDLVYQKPPGMGKVSDVDVMLLSSSRNPVIQMKFRDAFPVALTDATFDIRLPDSDFLTATASFQYISYAIERTPNA